MNRVQLPSDQDQLDAERYWADRPYKKWTVVVTAGPHNRPTHISTWYAGAQTAEGAISAVKRCAFGLPTSPSTRYRARLAGPRELGCMPNAAAGR